MELIAVALISTTLLAFGMAGSLEAGYRIGKRRLKNNPESKSEGAGAVESSVFAILGLRSLYFFLSGMLDKFEYMKYSLIFVLMFVGVKMMIVHFIHIPALLSLGIILFILTAGVVFSMLHVERK